NRRAEQEASPARTLYSDQGRTIKVLRQFHRCSKMQSFHGIGNESRELGRLRSRGPGGEEDVGIPRPLGRIDDTKSSGRHHPTESTFHSGKLAAGGGGGRRKGLPLAGEPGSGTHLRREAGCVHRPALASAGNLFL